MTGLLAFSMVGVAVALLRGGSLSEWNNVQVRWWFVAVASLGLQLILHNQPVDHQPWAITFGPLIWLACLSGLLAVLARNAVASTARATRLAWTVAAVGVGLNLLVVAANGGFMPQSSDARSSTRGAVAATDERRLRNVRPMSGETQLNALGDVIAEPTWLPNANVISIGDVLLGIGLGAWAFVTTSDGRRRRAA
ncbi:MAG TPA: DUF5317 family protein [Chloroflexota bacterium]|nr:DUF5317 family protein [Chloroflexota bacterium]